MYTMGWPRSDKIRPLHYMEEEVAQLTVLYDWYLVADALCQAFDAEYVAQQRLKGDSQYAALGQDQDELLIV